MELYLTSLFYLTLNRIDRRLNVDFLFRKRLDLIKNVLQCGLWTSLPNRIFILSQDPLLSETSSTFLCDIGCQVKITRMRLVRKTTNFEM